MSEPLFIDPLDHTDTELGSRIRDAHANGIRFVLLMKIGRACPICLRDMDVQENCVACGDERTCDSCGAGGELVFSPPHEAHFCRSCAAREHAPDPEDIPI